MCVLLQTGRLRECCVRISSSIPSTTCASRRVASYCIVARQSPMLADLGLGYRADFMNDESVQEVLHFRPWWITATTTTTTEEPSESIFTEEEKEALRSLPNKECTSSRCCRCAARESHSGLGGGGE